MMLAALKVDSLASSCRDGQNELELNTSTR
nr:MAG TPA: hypothetical protein [Caudoviricetes sp.]